MRTKSFLSDKNFSFITLLIFLLLSILLYFNTQYVDLEGDQTVLQALVANQNDPGLFESDPIYSKNIVYTPLYLKLVGLLNNITGDIKEAFRLQLPVYSFLYLAGMFFLIRYLTNHNLASLLGALISLPVRASLGGDFWGVEDLSSVLARTAFLTFLPYIILFYLKYRKSRAANILTFFLVGIAANIHPITGFFVCQIFCIFTLLDKDFSLKERFIRLFLGGMAAVVGVLPFAAQYTIGVTELAYSRENFELVFNAFKERFYFLIPFPFIISWSALLSYYKAIIFDFLPVLILGVLGYRLIESSQIKRFLKLWFISSIMLSVLGQLIIIYISKLTLHPPLIVDQIRGFRMVYLPLFISISFIFKKYLSDRQPVIKRSLLCGAIVLVLFITVTHVFSLKNFLTNQQVQTTDSRKELVCWIKKNTPENSLLYSDDINFRYETGRSLIGPWKDGGIAYYSAGEKTFLQWYKASTTYKNFKEQGDLLSLIKTGKDIGADYIILNCKDNYKIETSNVDNLIVFNSEDYCILGITN